MSSEFEEPNDEREIFMVSDDLSKLFEMSEPNWKERFYISYQSIQYQMGRDNKFGAMLSIMFVIIMFCFLIIIFCIKMIPCSDCISLRNQTQIFRDELLDPDLYKLSQWKYIMQLMK